MVMRHIAVQRTCCALMQPLVAILLPLAGWISSPALAEDGGVYVSGQGFTLEQAVDQALAESARRDNERFWIVVSGSEVGRVTKTGAGGEIVERIRKVRDLGGAVYVCQSDLARHAISEEELLEGVERISGYGTPAPGFPAAQAGSGLPSSVPQSRLILRSCADEEEPEEP